MQARRPEFTSPEPPSLCMVAYTKSPSVKREQRQEDCYSFLATDLGPQSVRDLVSRQ